MSVKLLIEHHFGVSKFKKRLHRLVSIYTCQNATLLGITCRGITISVCYLIQDKLLLLSTTTWASAADYTCIGDHGDVDASLWPLLVRQSLR